MSVEILYSLEVEQIEGRLPGEMGVESEEQ